MLVAVGLVLLGLVLLTVGGDILVRGASSLALLARITPTVVGLTIVAAGTSMPELMVAVQAAVQGSTDLAVGNVVGSNIFNIAAILGIAALIAPLAIHGNMVRLEWPVMMLAAWQFHLLARDRSVDRLEGSFLLAGVIAFMAYAVWSARKNALAEERSDLARAATDSAIHQKGLKVWLLSSIAVAAGVGMLVGGASALVHGASTVARTLGVSEAVIGLTVVAAGTSLPELAASCMAALRGQNDIAVANVIGSNIFNILAIVGATATIHPLPVPAEILDRDNWWMLGLSLLMFPLMRTGMRISRGEGCLLLGCFAGYMTVLIRSL